MIKIFRHAVDGCIRCRICRHGGSLRLVLYASDISFMMSGHKSFTRQTQSLLMSDISFVVPDACSRAVRRLGGERGDVTMAGPFRLELNFTFVQLPT